jgi:hypothetical protein
MGHAASDRSAPRIPPSSEEEALEFDPGCEFQTRFLARVLQMAPRIVPYGSF